MLPELSNKNVNVENVAEKTVEDKKLLSELLEGLKSKNETYRYNCFKVLNLISKENGELLYPEWEYFVEQLDGNNTYWKLSGLQIIANLTAVDIEKKFEKIFDKYYLLLDDKSMITAIYIARASGKIVRAKPELKTTITEKLLNIDETHHNRERIDLIKSGIIEAFSEYFEEADDKEKIIEFVSRQMDSSSPKTRKVAREFLKKWGTG